MSLDIGIIQGLQDLVSADKGVKNVSFLLYIPLPFMILNVSTFAADNLSVALKDRNPYHSYCMFLTIY